MTWGFLMKLLTFVLNIFWYSSKYEVSVHVQTVISVLALIIHWPSFSWKKLVYSIFSNSWHGMKLKLTLWYSLTFDHITLSRNSFWSANYILETHPKSLCHLLPPFVRMYHQPKFQLHTICEKWESRKGTLSSMNHVFNKKSLRSEV